MVVNNTLLYVYVCFLLQGNDIILTYRHSMAIKTNTPETIQVPFLEVSTWNIMQV